MHAVGMHHHQKEHDIAYDLVLLKKYRSHLQGSQSSCQFHVIIVNDHEQDIAIEQVKSVSQSRTPRVHHKREKSVW
jgi:hypothetical protein